VADGTLVAPESVVARFPRVPRAETGRVTPAGMLLPILDYDFGPAFDPNDMRGAIITPPRIRQVLPNLVPQIDEDGNELAGIKSPLVANPLGSYLGWNVTATGFARGQQCGFSGGFIPFATDQRERMANDDQRLSLTERYGSHAAYVDRVRQTAGQLVRERLLLAEDAERMVSDATRSDAFAPLASPKPELAPR